MPKSMNQISSTHLKSRLRYNYFGFRKTNSILEFYLVDHFTVIGVLFCVILPNFVQIGPPTAVTGGHIAFFKMAAATAQYYFRFRVCWCYCFEKVKIYQQANFRLHISIHGWDIITSCLEKTNVHHIEYHFRFRSQPFRRNVHVISGGSRNFVWGGGQMTKADKSLDCCRWVLANSVTVKVVLNSVCFVPVRT